MYRETFWQNKREKKWKIAALIIFIVTFYSPVIGAFLAGAIAQACGEYYIISKYMWVEFFLLPIPISSIAIGIKMKKMGLRRRRNTIIGVIMCIALCIFGMFAYWLSDINDAVKFVKEEMKIEIPSPIASDISSNHSTKDPEIFKDCSAAAYLFTEDETQKFKEQIDERWVSDFSEEFAELFPKEQNEFFAEYALFYNMTAGEYNKIPTAAGEYDIILLLLSDTENSFYILRYKYIVKA